MENTEIYIFDNIVNTTGNWAASHGDIAVTTNEAPEAFEMS